MNTNPQPTVSTDAIARNQYGVLDISKTLTQDQEYQFVEMRASAIEAGLLPSPYLDGCGRYFECLSLFTYDVLLSRRRVAGFIVQAITLQRLREMKRPKVTKAYYLVLRSAHRMTAQRIDGRACVRRAKRAAKLGQLIDHYLGKSLLPSKKPAVVTNMGCNTLTKTKTGHSGQLVNTHDGTDEYHPLK